MRPLFITCLLALSLSCSSSQESNASSTEASTSPEPATPDVVEASDAATPSEALETTDMNQDASGLYALEASSLEGDAMDLSAFQNQVTLVVNVASQCGYTRQYTGLQELHAEFAERGFAVLAFPSNQFGGQEPGSAAEIRQFCTEKYDVSFPMFAKGDVKGADQSPVYSFLEEQTGEVPGWNFCKYLVGKDGQVISFHKSGVEPNSEELRKAIEAAIG